MALKACRRLSARFASCTFFCMGESFSNDIPQSLALPQYSNGTLLGCYAKVARNVLVPRPSQKSSRTSSRTTDPESSFDRFGNRCPLLQANRLCLQIRKIIYGLDYICGWNAKPIVLEIRNVNNTLGRLKQMD